MKPWDQQTNNRSSSRAIVVTISLAFLGIALIAGGFIILWNEEPDSRITVSLKNSIVGEYVGTKEELLSDSLDINNATATEGGQGATGAPFVTPTPSEGDTAESMVGIEGPPLNFDIKKNSRDESALLTPSVDAATFDGANTKCIVDLDMKKVALMFLTQGPMPFESVWEAWIHEAAGLLPKSAFRSGKSLCLQQCLSGRCTKQCGKPTACNPLCREELWLRYGGQMNGRRSQHLFNIYTHPPPATDGTVYNESSIFYMTEIPTRIATSWSHYSLAEAARLLIKQALRDASNHWFVLISETSVPLYSPAFFWQQLMQENLSRIDACTKDLKTTMYESRATPAMKGEHFDPASHWRKSSQWFMLTRNHAEVVANDSEVADLFKEHCKVGNDSALNRWRDCISDEHYVPSLLASRGLENETTCSGGGGTFVSWSYKDKTDSNHPREFQKGELTGDVVRGIRNWPIHAHCSVGAEEKIQGAITGFINIDTLEEDVCSGEEGSLLPGSFYGNKFKPLNSKCNLIARKIAPDAAGALMDLYRDCNTALGILKCDAETTKRNSLWW